MHLDNIISDGVQLIQVSCYTEEGVTEVKNAACDALLSHRVESKLKGSKINSVINRIHVALPKPRDEVVREPYIPEAVKIKKKYDALDPERKKLERDLEAEEGGAGVYSIDLRSQCILISISGWTIGF